MTSSENLTRLIEGLSSPTLQNTFMRLTDREVAISLKFLDKENQHKVLSLLPQMKAERIREEIRLFKTRIRVPRAKSEQVVSHVISVLKGESRGNVSSYIKPGNRN